MTLRTSLLASLLLAATACPSSSDIGKACDKKEDCEGALICDVHDGKGTCQEPHGHDSAGETHEDTAHGGTHEDTSHHVTGGEDTAHGGTAEDTAHGETAEDTAHGGTAEDTGGNVGDVCTNTEECSGDLECDVHDGEGTCQEPHDHVGG